MSNFDTNGPDSIGGFFKQFAILVGATMILPLIAASLLVSNTAASIFFFVFLLFPITFIVSMFTVQGVALITAIAHLIGAIFSKKMRNTTEGEMDKKLKSFRWAFPIVGAVLFGLAGFMFRDGSWSDGDSTHLIFFITGIGYGFLLGKLYQHDIIDLDQW